MELKHNRSWDQMSLKDRVESTNRHRVENIIMGKLCGYPQCCIDAYINHIDDYTPEQNEIWGPPHWYFPCKSHGIKLFNNEETIPEILVGRHKDLPGWGMASFKEIEKKLKEIIEREGLL